MATKVRSFLQYLKESRAAESDCSLHVFPVRVKIEKRTAHHARIIGGLLRILAEYTDGFCSYRDALDTDLTQAGMIFRFTTEEKRTLFCQRIPFYLSAETARQLTITTLRKTA